MSPTWFTIKCLFLTFGIVSFLQIRVGSEAKPLEIYFTDWMKGLSASKRIQDVANGGKELTTDIIKEFTTPDGRKIYIKEKIQSPSRKDASENLNLGMDSQLIQRLISGIKINLSDLNLKDQLSVKEQVKKEIEDQVRSDYEAKLRSAGIDPKTLDQVKN